MRFINMNDLPYVRRTQLAGHTCIGKGSFASVFAPSPDSPTVAKVTTDSLSYCLLTDGVWHSMREEVDACFTKVIEDHGDVGDSCGMTAYLVEVERLFPVSTTEHRRLIAAWSKEYDAFKASFSGRTHRMATADVWHLKSLEFCGAKGVQDDEPYRAVFSALEEFIGSFGGALDLKRNNFMCRANGDLVWNDVVFDVKTFSRH